MALQDMLTSYQLEGLELGQLGTSLPGLQAPACPYAPTPHKVLRLLSQDIVYPADSSPADLGLTNKSFPHP